MGVYEVVLDGVWMFWMVLGGTIGGTEVSKFDGLGWELIVEGELL